MQWKPGEVFVDFLENSSIVYAIGSSSMLVTGKAIMTGDLLFTVTGA